MNDKLREKLLALEDDTPLLKEKYEKEIHKMLEKPVKPHEKVLLQIGTGLSAFLGIVFVFIGATNSEKLPVMASMFLFAASLIFFTGAYIAYRYSTSKTHTIKIHELSACALYISTIILWVITLLLPVNEGDEVMANHFMLYGLAFLIFGTFAMVHFYISRAERNTKEHLLKLELQLAELNEKLGEEKNINSTKD